jgi:hypothetical protein
MTLPEFKQRAAAAFGPSMEHATPANVREFLDLVARDRWREEHTAHGSSRSGEPPAPLEIPHGESTSYEDILRQFFADALSAPNEQALIHLWLLALDLAYAGLEEQAAQQIGPLFADRNP